MDTDKLVRDIVANVMSRIGPDGSGTAAAGADAGAGSQKGSKKVVCGVSVRHVHLSREHVDVLFGKGYEMKVLKELYQPGTYAYKETVTVVRPRANGIQNTRVPGPLKNNTNKELAK